MRKRPLPGTDESPNGCMDLPQSPPEVRYPNGPLLLFREVKSKSNFVFTIFAIFITFGLEIGFKKLFFEYFSIPFVENRFYTCFLCSDRSFMRLRW